VEFQALMRWVPHGVAVLTVDSGGERLGLTVDSFVSLSLDPPLVGISLALSASLYEVLREAGAWSVSMLAADQDHLAQHFARSIPPIALWDGIAVREDDPHLLVGAVGWLQARTVQEVAAGDHTVFIGELLSIEQGPGRGALVYLHRDYVAL
jgi:flavin reductase (DIM6/NTAB) family NADH-FMN oxidoreductase RutF